jgi:hypothetical protein
VWLKGHVNTVEFIAMMHQSANVRKKILNYKLGGFLMVIKLNKYMESKDELKLALKINSGLNLHVSGEHF